MQVHADPHCVIVQACQSDIDESFTYRVGTNGMESNAPDKIRYDLGFHSPCVMRSVMRNLSTSHGYKRMGYQMMMKANQENLSADVISNHNATRCHW